MHLPPAVHVAPGRSRQAAVCIVLLALVSLGVLAVLPLHPVLVGLGVIAVLAWAGDRLLVVAWGCGPRAVHALWVTGDRLVVVRHGSGRLVAGHVRSASYVGARLTTIVWRPDGARMSRSLWLLPDMLPAEEFRQLRVLLRYARSDDAHGVPASQA